VREELERMQGRMRVLADLTALTTVDLSVVEIRGFRPAEAPTLITRMRRAFESSWQGLVHMGETLLVTSVAALPWLGLLVVILAVGWLLIKATFRRRSSVA
jgi:hypothetical protein